MTLIERTCLDNVRYLPVKLFSLFVCVFFHLSLVTQEGGRGVCWGDRYVHP